MAPSDRVQGEEDLIQSFLAPLAAGHPGAFGLRDDCAALTPPPGEDLILNTDAIAQGVHFFADDPPAAIAWKSLAVNVSDLAAKGARPLVYLMSLSFPQAPSRAWMSEFATGLRDAQVTFACQLVGGDTDCRPGPLAITIMMIGALPTGRMVRRGAAKPGDRLYVTGTLGCAALGLALRSEPKLVDRYELDSAETSALVGRYLRPQPRVALAPVLRASASAAMDLSDGLVKDLGRMAKSSGVGARVWFHQLPLSAPARRILEQDPARDSAIVASGDDYEILVSVPLTATAAFETGANSAGVSVAAIGEVDDSRTVSILDAEGHPMSFERSGFDHF